MPAVSCPQCESAVSCEDADVGKVLICETCDKWFTLSADALQAVPRFVDELPPAEVVPLYAPDNGPLASGSNATLAAIGGSIVFAAMLVMCAGLIWHART